MAINYKIFTANLARINDIRRSIDEIRSRLEVMEYEESGVKGIDYTHTPMAHNPSLTALKRLEMVDKVDELTRQLNWLTATVEEIETMLAKMPEELQTMLTEVYVKNMTFRAVGIKHGYSDHGLWQMLKRETERYL